MVVVAEWMLNWLASAGLTEMSELRPVIVPPPAEALIVWFPAVFSVIAREPTPFDRIPDCRAVADLLHQAFSERLWLEKCLTKEPGQFAGSHSACH